MRREDQHPHQRRAVAGPRRGNVRLDPLHRGHASQRPPGDRGVGRLGRGDPARRHGLRPDEPGDGDRLRIAGRGADRGGAHLRRRRGGGGTGELHRGDAPHPPSRLPPGLPGHAAGPVVAQGLAAGGFPRRLVGAPRSGDRRSGPPRHARPRPPLRRARCRQPGRRRPSARRRLVAGPPPCRRGVRWGVRGRCRRPLAGGARLAGGGGARRDRGRARRSRGG